MLPIADVTFHDIANVVLAAVLMGLFVAALGMSYAAVSTGFSGLRWRWRLWLSAALSWIALAALLFATDLVTW